MFKKVLSSLFVSIAILVSAACASKSNTTAPATSTPAANMPNPASVYCEKNDGMLDLRTDASGGVAGVCVFADKSECDEWAYFRGECKPGDVLPTVIPTAAPAVGMANPASVFCEKNGGKLDLRTDASGGVAGVCVFPDKSECDEWAYFRGECKPGDAIPAVIANPALVTADDGWKVYRNDTLGFSFQYPVDATIGSADDPAKTLTITGPLVGNEHWPMIYINYPSDREDYHPTVGADLAQWLTDHNLLVGDRQPDVQIAGTTATHTRLPRGQQSFASDHYFFAHSGQLFGIVILHTGDKEDWNLYNHFLASFQF